MVAESATEEVLGFGIEAILDIAEEHSEPYVQPLTRHGRSYLDRLVSDKDAEEVFRGTPMLWLAVRTIWEALALQRSTPASAREAAQAELRKALT